MKFTKMHGCGNDYVYVDCTKEELATPSDIAKAVSDRHFGIGSDGLILICPSEVADCEMAMYNADGSRGEMCGNGVRCVGKYMYDYGLTDKTEITVETLAGIKTLQLFIENGKVAKVRVDMGSPILTPAEIPVVAEGDKAVDEPILVDGKEYHMTCVSMGNPHAVVYVDDVDNLPIEEIGPKFESHERFPRRVNTEFVKVLDRHTVQMRVWERGSAETLACGTGACASVVAGILKGCLNNSVEVELLGGSVRIDWDGDKVHTGRDVFLTGPAEYVFTAEL